MKIAIVVHGRFHAFELGASLRRKGHDVWVYTNYSAAEGARFGLERAKVRSLIVHRIFMRLWSMLLGERHASSLRDQILHRGFGAWAARRVRADGPFDVVHCFSGVAMEVLKDPLLCKALRTIVRGSSHIEYQRTLVLAESQRSSAATAIPSDWIVSRELGEYALADRILVLSGFALSSFRGRGLDGGKLQMTPCGVEVGQFRATATVLDRRRQRLRDGGPLRIVFAGHLSTRKGAADFLSAMEALGGRAKFAVIGEVEEVWRTRLAQRKLQLDCRSRVDQHVLPSVYADHDVFLFPTLEDGFGMVIPQAMAAGLIVVTTPRSAGPDLIKDGYNGVLVAPADPDALVDALRRIDADRDRAMSLACAAAGTALPDWDAAAESWLRAHAITSPMAVNA